MTARDYLNERGDKDRFWGWAPVGWFLTAIPLFGLLEVTVAWIVFGPGMVVIFLGMAKAGKRFRCAHCGENLTTYKAAGFGPPISSKVKFFPCCRGSLDADVTTGEVHDDNT